VSIKDFNFATQKSSDIKEKHAILAIEDKASSKGLSEILKTKGYRIIGETPNADEVLELVRKHKMGLLFLDFDVEGLGSMMILEKLKIKTPKIKTIIMANHLDKQQVTDARKRGVAGFLAKPLSKNAVVSLLSKSSIM